MMNQDDIFKKIGQIINELSDQYQYLAQNPQELNELELELFLANANFLSDHVQIIKKITGQSIQKALPEQTKNQEEINVPQPEVQPYKEELLLEEPVVSFEQPIEESVKSFEQPIVSFEQPIDEPLNWFEQPSEESVVSFEQPIEEPVKSFEQPAEEPVVSFEQPIDELVKSFEQPLEEPVASFEHPADEHIISFEKTDREHVELEPQVIHSTPRLIDDIFKPDIEPSTFEFILNEKPTSDRFEFEEKPVDEIFDRPLSKEEELIIAQKQKLREMDSLETQPTEEDEIGPEPFLVEEPAVTAAEIELPEEEHSVVEEITPPVVPAKPEPVVEFKAPPVSIVQEELFRPVATVAEPRAEEQPKTQPLAKPTLNDILSGNTANRNLNSASSRAPITDLKQAISLNDKMRYIKDLFNGYNLAYAEAIDLVNKMPDFKTADTFLKSNYAAKHNWADKQDTVDQFYELLNLRFPLK